MLKLEVDGNRCKAVTGSLRWKLFNMAMENYNRICFKIAGAQHSDDKKHSDTSLINEC